MVYKMAIILKWVQDDNCSSLYIGSKTEYYHLQILPFTLIEWSIEKINKNFFIIIIISFFLQSRTSYSVSRITEVTTSLNIVAIDAKFYENIFEIKLC